MDMFIIVGLTIGLVAGIVIGIFTAAKIFDHYHHCMNKCSVEDCLKDGTNRIWSDQMHNIIYVCDSHGGKGFLKQGLKEAKYKLGKWT